MKRFILLPRLKKIDRLLNLLADESADLPTLPAFPNYVPKSVPNVTFEQQSDQHISNEELETVKIKSYILVYSMRNKPIQNL